MKTITSFTKDNLSYITAVFTWALTTYILYFLQYQVYGGLLDTGVIFVAIIPPLNLLFTFIYYEENKVDEKKNLRTKIINTLGNIALIGVTIFLIWAALKKPYILRIYQFFSVFAFIALISLFDKHQLRKIKRKVLHIYFHCSL